MKWIYFRCICDTDFSIPEKHVPLNPKCPSCGDDWNVDKLGEYTEDMNLNIS